MPSPADLRDAVDGLTSLATADLRHLWRPSGSAEHAKAALADILPPILDTYTLASATVAADWYDEHRDELNIDGRFSAIVADLGDLGADALAGFAVGPLFQADPDWAAARMLADGGVQLRIANAARETIRQSSIADPKARGWQRVALAGCAFCQMLAGRGAVYSRDTVDFAAHDHCRCFAAPAFTGRPAPVKPYTPSERNITAADRARVRAWLRDNAAG